MKLMIESDFSFIWDEFRHTFIFICFGRLDVILIQETLETKNRCRCSLQGRRALKGVVGLLKSRRMNIS